jgi:hypothetical protein
MSNRQTLLDEMQTARTELDETVNALVASRRMDFYLGDGWRVRDVIAHLALWERVANRKLSGAELPYGSDVAAMKPWNLDAFNETMRERMWAMPDDELLAEYYASHAALLGTVTAAEDDACAPGGRVFQVIDEDSAGHYGAHLPALGGALDEHNASSPRR